MVINNNMVITSFERRVAEVTRVSVILKHLFGRGLSTRAVSREGRVAHTRVIISETGNRFNPWFWDSKSTQAEQSSCVVISAVPATKSVRQIRADLVFLMVNRELWWYNGRIRCGGIVSTITAPALDRVFISSGLSQGDGRIPRKWCC